MKRPTHINLTSIDKASLLLIVGALILFSLDYSKGNTKPAAVWLVVVFGCAIMIFAQHKDFFKLKK